MDKRKGRTQMNFIRKLFNRSSFSRYEQILITEAVNGRKEWLLKKAKETKGQDSYSYNRMAEKFAELEIRHRS